MAEKPTKAELAKLPGGEHFDVDNATQEEYDKHVEILRRRAEVAGLTPVTLTSTDSAAPTEVGITKIDRRNGNAQTLPAKAWSLLPPEDLEEFEDSHAHVDKPKG